MVPDGIDNAAQIRFLSLKDLGGRPAQNSQIVFEEAFPDHHEKPS